MLISFFFLSPQVRRKMRSGFAVQSLPHAIEVSRDAHAEEESETSIVPDESVQSSTCTDRRDLQEKKMCSSVEHDKKQEISSEEVAGEYETNREKDEAVESSEDDTELMTVESDIETVKSREESTSDEIEDRSQNVTRK